MKKLLFIVLAAMGLLLVPVQRSDAQITVGVGGVGVGFGYPGYRYGYYGSGYYPYGYYRPYRSYSYYSGLRCQLFFLPDGSFDNLWVAENP